MLNGGTTMLLDLERIEQLQAQLAVHRRRLAYRLHQQARLGDYTPPEIMFDIEDAHTAIHRLKTELQAAGVAMPDDPLDLAKADSAFMSTTKNQRNRARLLQKIRDFWIAGVLEHSLHGAALIALGLETRPEAVMHPWELTVQQEGVTAQVLAPGTTLIDVFDEQVGELLILGAPGAGKTTLLLELARTLLDRAEEDAGMPMPVVFNLSSWAEKRSSLVAWLVDELNGQYDIPRSLAQEWIANDQILPLLDGLDEVPAGQRAACVEAINAFRKEHGLVNLVVCSRLADYAALARRLKLRGALLVRSLTPTQIDAYLAAAGEQLAGLRAALAQDTTLCELAETPLMLSILMLTYQGQSATHLPTLATLEEQRNRVFSAYVTRMFQRRSQTLPYTPSQTIGWLAWLAQSMLQHQSIFHLERLQPSWLSLPLRRWYQPLVLITLVASTGLFLGIAGEPRIRLQWGCSLGLAITLGYLFSDADSSPLTPKRRALWGLLIGVFICLYYMLPMINKPSPYALRLLVGPIIGLPAGLLAALLAGYTTRLAAPVARRLRMATSSGLGAGLNVGVSTGLVVLVIAGPVQGLQVGLAFGVGVGLLFTMASRILVVERLHWSWRSGLSTAASVGLFYLLATLLEGTLSAHYHEALRAALSFGLLAGITGGEIEQRTRPNQGIRRSARNTLWGLAAGILAGVFVLAVEQQIGQALQTGTIVALLCALRGGLLPCIQHSILRVMLYGSGVTPRKYVHFLDYAVDRIFLRRVGGGYIFGHRLLMEYFAQQR